MPRGCVAGTPLPHNYGREQREHHESCHGFACSDAQRKGSNRNSCNSNSNSNSNNNTNNNNTQSRRDDNSYTYLYKIQVATADVRTTNVRHQHTKLLHEAPLTITSAYVHRYQLYDESKQT